MSNKSELQTGFEEWAINNKFRCDRLRRYPQHTAWDKELYIYTSAFTQVAWMAYQAGELHGGAAISYGELLAARQGELL